MSIAFVLDTESVDVSNTEAIETDFQTIRFNQDRFLVVFLFC